MIKRCNYAPGSVSVVRVHELDQGVSKNVTLKDISQVLFDTRGCKSCAAGLMCGSCR